MQKHLVYNHISCRKKKEEKTIIKIVANECSVNRLTDDFFQFYLNVFIP